MVQSLPVFCCQLILLVGSLVVEQMGVELVVDKQSDELVSVFQIDFDMKMRYSNSFTI